MKKIILIILLVFIKQINAQTCQANFTYALGANGNATFTNASTGTTASTKYFWTWGDSYGQAAAGPYTHAFYYNGTYSVTLNINDSVTGCNSTITNTIAIANAQPCNIQASMSYSISPNGNTVTYVNTSTGNGGLCVTTFVCPFGGNGHSKDSVVYGGNGSGAGGTTLTYPYNGTFTNTLTVNGGGCSSTFMDTVVISGQLTCNLSTSYTDTLRSNGQVDFYNASTGVLSNMKSIWYFGDGTLPDTATSASHNYAYNGTYHVTLFVRDSFYLCKDSISKNITIANALNTCTASPSFTLSPNSAQAHAWFAQPSYPSQVVNAVWSWGDGSSSNGLYPSHTYSAAGSYSICVKVYLACGDSVTYCQVEALSKNSSTNQVIQISVVNSITGIKDITSINTELNVYPNPSTGIFTIESTSSNKQSVQVYDATGKLVLSQSIYNKTTIDASSLNQGIYNIILVTDQGILSKRLIIVR